VALFTLYTAVLYASFAHDAFRVAGPFRDGHIGYDSHLVLTRLQLATEGEPWWAPLGSYWSQFGLQGVCLSAAMTATGVEPITFAFLAAKVFALLSAAVLALFFASVTHHFGTLAGSAGVGLTALSPVLIEFGPSLYWATFLLFAPFVAAWLLAPWAGRSSRGQCALLAILFVLVLLKALCGYEFVTTVILSPLAAQAFHRHLDGRWSWRFLGTSAAVCLAGLAGFGTALVLHVTQLSHVPTVRDTTGAGGLQYVVNHAYVRVARDPNEELFRLSNQGRAWGLTEPVTPLRCFAHYFRLPAAAVPQSLPLRPRGAKLAFVVLFAAAAAAAALLGGGRRSPAVRALAVSLVVGFAASVSWQVLAVNHMCVHYNLNRIVFHLPFLPLAYATAGYAADRLLARIGWDAVAARAVPPACAALAVAGSLADANIPGRTADADKCSQAHVRAHLAAGRPDDARIRGGIERMAREADDAETELGRSRLAGTNAAERDAWVVRGWAKDASAANRLAFVVVQGRRPVPCRMARTGRGEFTLTVPCRLTRDGQPLRVFAVSEQDRTRVRELTPPASTARR
jgi:hypothetical protein